MCQKGHKVRQLIQVRYDISNIKTLKREINALWEASDKLACKKNRLPAKIMITIHPQRRHDKPLPWIKELIWQNVKNGGKRVVISIR